jgi:outer membrane biosynthesis protein TonB
VLVVALAGCSSANPDAELADDIEAVIAEANDNDAGGVRDKVDVLLQTIRRLGGTGQLRPAREAELNALALAVLDNVELLDAKPSPSPSPSPLPSRSPSPSPKPPPPSPSPSPSPTEEEEEEEPSEQPSPSPGKGKDKSPLIILPT